MGGIDPLEPPGRGVAMSKAQSHPRRRSFSTGVLMAVVIVAALLSVLVVVVTGPEDRARLRSLLDLMLALPVALAVLLLLLGPEPRARTALGRALAAWPILPISIFYFHAIVIGLLLISDSPHNGFWGFLRPSIAYLVLLPAAYYSLVLVLLPPRCPHCNHRMLEPEVWAAAADPGRPALARCDDCGARCWRSPKGAWVVDLSPVPDDLAWFTKFAPKLRTLRRELRPH
jgi:hypothetical protein